MAADPIHQFQITKLFTVGTVGGQEIAFTNSSLFMVIAVGLIGTLLVGSVRLWPVRIGTTAALLLGPLTVEPAFRERGIGHGLIERALTTAKAKGHRLVMLVGDEPYYGRSGFKPIPKGRVSMPGPVDPARLLVCELVVGAFEGVSGAIRAAGAATN